MIKKEKFNPTVLLQIYSWIVIWSNALYLISSIGKIALEFNAPVWTWYNVQYIRLLLIGGTSCHHNFSTFIYYKSFHFYQKYEWQMVGNGHRNGRGNVTSFLSFRFRYWYVLCIFQPWKDNASNNMKYILKLLDTINVDRK